jgi:hypothetical protein
MKTVTLLLALAGLFQLAGCSGEDEDDGHVWQEQTETLDRARATEDQIMKSAEEQRRAIENIDKE